MKVVLLTTLLGLVENARIQTEVENLGHTFRLVNLSDFSFTAGVDGLTIAELGCGMFCTIGSFWKDINVKIYPSDALADDFNQILKEAGICPLCERVFT